MFQIFNQNFELLNPSHRIQKNENGLRPVSLFKVLRFTNTMLQFCPQTNCGFAHVITYLVARCQLMMHATKFCSDPGFVICCLTFDVCVNYRRPIELNVKVNLISPCWFISLFPSFSFSNI